jgi:glycosyltransferase involved in cell wall biosynthesis
VKLHLVFDHRFVRAPDGRLHSPVHYSYSLFRDRYLSVFDEVILITRVFPARSGFAHHPEPTEGPGVRVLSTGAWGEVGGFLRARGQVIRLLRERLREPSAWMLISPGKLAALAGAELRRRRHPYGVEVVSDPWDSLAPGALRHPLRPLIRRWVAHQLRLLCAHAATAGYVTRRTLQERYPPAPDAATEAYSSIRLEPEDFVAAPPAPRPATAPRLISVGSMAHHLKGFDLLLRALPALRGEFPGLTLDLVGDGARRAEYEALAVSLGVAGAVRFLGKLPPGASVRAALDQADLFVLASRGEGLPRAMIEAMARGLPCLGAAVSGIPELLDPPALFPGGDPEALARTAATWLRDPAARARLAAANLARAREYEHQALQARRERLYRALRERTAAAENRR